MSTATETTNSPLLVLPWNRWPNYYIIAVTIINVITGVFTLRAAYRFAIEIDSFNDALAAVTIGLFGLMLVWVGWCFRKGVLPAKFTADRVSRECGFRWAGMWNGRYDLSGADRLIGELRPYRDRWNWAILIPAESNETKDTWVYGSWKPLESQSAAEASCRENLERLATHLDLPSEIRTALQSIS